MKEERIISDDPRSGHPISVLTDENIERLRQIIEEDPHSTSQVESVSSDPIGNFTFSPQSDYQTLPEIGDRNSLRIGFKLIVYALFSVIGIRGYPIASRKIRDEFYLVKICTREIVSINFYSKCY